MNIDILSKKRIGWVTIVAFIIAIVLLILAFQRVDWNDLATTIRSANWTYICFAGGLVSLMSFVRSLRWRVLLSATRLLKVVDVFWATMIGYFGNTFLPARSGEIIRSVSLGKRGNISSSFVIATTLTERILDAMALVVIGAIALVVTPDVPPIIIKASKTFSIISFVGLIGVLIFPRLEQLLKRLLRCLPFTDNITNTLVDILEKFNDGMKSLRSTKRSIQFLLLTALIWLGDAVVSITIAKSMGLTLSVSQALLLSVTLGLSSAIPSTPGYIGIYQFVAVSVLPPFGFTHSQALGFILVLQALSIVMTTIWGLLGTWQFGLLNFHLFLRDSNNKS